LIVVDNRVFAYQPVSVNTLQVVATTASGDGSLAVCADPVVFPDWVNTAPQDKNEFLVQPTAEDQFLLLAWEAHAYYHGGAAPPRQIMAQSRKDAVGLARIDLHTGKVAMLPNGPAPPTSSAPPSSAFLPPDPIVREQRQIGFHLYALVEEERDNSPRRSILKKYEVASKKLIWELSLDEWQASRAPPRRM
jgi:hypothetical protein